jgi:hypothetical protein
MTEVKLTIGSAGVNIETVRYYQRRRLLGRFRVFKTSGLVRMPTPSMISV